MRPGLGWFVGPPATDLAKSGVLTLFNRTTRHFHGLPEAPVPAEEWAQKFDLYHGDGVTPLQKEEVPLFRALRGEVVSDAEMVIAPKNGLARVVSTNGQAITDGAGRILGAVAVMHDISASKAAEAELRESHLFAQSIAKNSTSIIYLFDLDLLANVYANRDVTGFLGYSAAEVQAMGDQILPTIVHPDDLPFLLSHLASFGEKADGEVVEFETRIRHASGDYRWIASREVIFKRHIDGTPWQILGNSHDVTERKEAAAQLQKAHDELETRVARRTYALAQANDQLHETSDRLQAILDNATAVVYLKDLQGRYLLINHQFETLFGITREKIVGKTDYDLFPPEMAATFALNDQKVLQAGAPLEIEEEAPQDEGLHTYISIKFPLRRASGEIYAICGLSTDITERKQGEIALQAAKDEAERANRAKSELLSRTSHELRTPLNAILGFGQLLEMGELSPGQSKCVAQILKAGRHQLTLVDRVLDLARLETGDLPLALEPVFLGEMCEEALQLARPLASAGEVHLLLSQSAQNYAKSRVLADPTRLVQVLLNLLSNAIKYNHAGGDVTISVSQSESESERLRLSVSDSGRGLSPAEIRRLFRLFDRIGADDAGVAGTGIGLTLCKGLIEAMGGAIGVESAPGQGSTFWIELKGAVPFESPFSMPFASPLSPGQREGNGTDWCADITASQNSPATSVVVLYIEDDLANLHLIQEILRSRPGIKLLAAIQGGLGLELAQKHRPDLILLDLHLPDLGGEEVLRRLQKDETTREIPVIVVSADDTPLQVERFLAAGAVEYLTKSLDVRQFMEMLEAHLVKKAPIEASGTRFQ